jgi:hypothetical protein
MRNTKWAVVKFINIEQRQLCLANIEIDFQGQPILEFKDWPEDSISRISNQEFDMMSEDEFMIHATEFMNHKFGSTTLQ